ncbi:hypothetical protein EBU95_18400 [bacterium]|nr:hypothetical protein [bacterium]
MKLKEILFGNSLFESKQTIMNLGFPEVVASIFNELFGNKAFIIAKWFRDYETFDNFGGRIDNYAEAWKSRSFNFSPFQIRLRKEVAIYNAIKESESDEDLRKNVDAVHDQYMYENTEDFSLKKKGLLSYQKNEIKETLKNLGFFDKNIIKDLLSGNLRDLAPYKTLSFSEANERYEEKKIFSDIKPLKTYENGWRWIDVGKKCEYVGDRMRNCGSSGVMSTDPDRTIIALFDAQNIPHVVTTYSPNQNRISGDEGGASTAVKDEYSDYVLDLATLLGANFDAQDTKSKLLKLKSLIGDKLKSIKRLEIDSTFDEYFLLTAKDGRKYYTNSYSIVPEEVIKTLRTNLPKEIVRKKRLKTIKDFVVYSFGMYNQDDIKDTIPGYEQILIGNF